MSARTNEAGGPTLEAGAIALPGVLMQAITHIGPAIGLLFTVQATASVAGTAAAFALGIGGLAMLLVGVSVIQLSKKVSSAGGYFTWASTLIGPRSGFIVAWAFLLYEPIGAGITLSFMGGVLEFTLKSAYGIYLPWWVTVLVGTAILTAVALAGLKLSIKVVVALGIFEVGCGIALAATGLLHPGNGGFNFSPFLPTSASSFNGLFLGVVLAVFSYTGFEAVAPLAEESANPTKTLPRAIILSLSIAIFFFVFISWGLLVGWGTNDLKSFVSNGSPALTFARNVWGNWWVLVLIAFINSILGVGVAVMNASTRVVFGMARAGVLPSFLAVVHRKRKTPTNAVLLESLVTLVVGLGGGALLGATGLLGFAAIIVTILIIVVYISGNIAVYRLYKKSYPGEYSPLTHLVIPVVSSLLLLFVGYKTLFPLPSGVAAFAPIVAIAWLLIGVIIVVVLSARGRLNVLRGAASAMTGNVPAQVDDLPTPEPRSKS